MEPKLYLLRMIWEKLNRFTTISKFKSLSEAARIGNISQSTWSRDISDLEKNFGFRLVSRTYIGIKLTRKGSSLLQIVNNFKNELDHFKTNS